MKKKVLVIILSLVSIFIYFNFYTYIKIDNNIKIKKYLYEKSNLSDLTLDKENYGWIVIDNGRFISTSLASYHINKYNDIEKFIFSATKGYKISIKNDYINICYISEIKLQVKNFIPKTLLILNYPYIFQVSDYNKNRLKNFINENCKNIKYLKKKGQVTTHYL